MKISFASLSIAAILITTQTSSAQSIYNPPRPAATPNQSGFALIASSMNNYHPGIGNSMIAINSRAAMVPLVAPSTSLFRPRVSTFQPIPFASAPIVSSTGLPNEQVRPR